MKNKLLMTALPWLLMVFGFLTLNMFQGYLALACMVIGIVMIIERIRPEKWGVEKNKKNSKRVGNPLASHQ